MRQPLDDLDSLNESIREARHDALPRRCVLIGQDFADALERRSDVVRTPDDAFHTTIGTRAKLFRKLLDGFLGLGDFQCVFERLDIGHRSRKFLGKHAACFFGQLAEYIPVLLGNRKRLLENVDVCFLVVTGSVAGFQLRLRGQPAGQIAQSAEIGLLEIVSTSHVRGQVLAGFARQIEQRFPVFLFGDDSGFEFRLAALDGIAVLFQNIDSLTFRFICLAARKFLEGVFKGLIVFARQYPLVSGGVGVDIGLLDQISQGFVVFVLRDDVAVELFLQSPQRLGVFLLLLFKLRFLALLAAIGRKQRRRARRGSFATQFSNLPRSIGDGLFSLGNRCA